MKSSMAVAFAEAMRAAHPGRHRQKHVMRMLADRGAYPSASTVATWLSGETMPAPEYLVHFIEAYGPALLALIYEDPLRRYGEKHADDRNRMGASALPHSFSAR